VKGDCGVVAAVAGDSPVGSSARVDGIVVDDGRRAASDLEAGADEEGELVKAVDWAEGRGKTQMRSRTRLCCVFRTAAALAAISGDMETLAGSGDVPVRGPPPFVAASPSSRTRPRRYACVACCYCCCSQHSTAYPPPYACVLLKYDKVCEGVSRTFRGAERRCEDQQRAPFLERVEGTSQDIDRQQPLRLPALEHLLQRRQGRGQLSRRLGDPKARRAAAHLLGAQQVEQALLLARDDPADDLAEVSREPLGVALGRQRQLRGVRRAGGGRACCCRRCRRRADGRRQVLERRQERVEQVENVDADVERALVVVPDAKGLCQLVCHHPSHPRVSGPRLQARAGRGRTYLLALVRDALPEVIGALVAVADEEGDDIVDRLVRGRQPAQERQQLHVDLERVVVHAARDDEWPRVREGERRGRRRWVGESRADSCGGRQRPACPAC
jgi:hypothetical protein